MVTGLDLFRQHFADFTDRYVLIGGAACDLVMAEAGLQFRVTKDLDIVLCIEALDADFARSFWAFVRLGKYKLQEKSTGDRQFYRFQKPQSKGFPAMLELFSRVLDALSVSDESHLTPIPFEETVSSLSAILLSQDYYRWIHAGNRLVENVRVVGSEQLIPLKAKAWLDLTARKAAGGKGIDSKDIKKHKNDVFRLFPLLTPEPLPEIPQIIRRDLGQFLLAMDSEQVALKNLGCGGRSKKDILTSLRRIYGTSM